MSSRSNNPLWDYFTKIEGKNKVASCNRCSKHLSFRSSITNLKIHLKYKHIGLYKLLAQREPHNSEKKYRQLDTDAYSQLVPMESTPSTSAHHESFAEELKQEITDASIDTEWNILHYAQLQDPLHTEVKMHIDAMLLKFIVKTYQPVSIVEEPDFVEFVHALNPNYVLPGRKVISETLIPFLYNRCREEKKQMLKREAVTVCLTTDCWTSAEMDAFISVTAHYINDDFEFKSVLLKCSVINGALTSQNIATVLRKTCMEWKILDKVNFCVTDNCANIVGAINFLGWTHYGCKAHKLNFTLQHLLKIFDDTIKKVKKIVTSYRASYKATEKLKEYQAKVQGSSQPLVLINSVATRWISTYFMIERFVYLQDAVRATTPKLGGDLPTITNEEWTALKQLCQVLKPFNEATQELSAEKYACASKAVAVINGLKDVMGKLKRKPDYFDTVKNAVDCIETQLNSRFQGIEQDQCLALCTVLDPRYKISMFIDESAGEAAKSNLVNQVFNLLVKNETGTTDFAPAEPQSSRVNNDEISLWRKRDLFLEKRRVSLNQSLLQIAQKEVELYLQDEFLDNNCNPGDWWRSSGQYKYPHLGKLYKANNNIVATSVPSERLFSKAGYTLSERRTRLSVKKTEQLLFLNSNMVDCDYKKLIALKEEG